MKLYYLAGPMRGVFMNNYPAFHAAAKELRKMGHGVWNPAEHDTFEGGFTFAKAMERDLAEVCKCDGVIVLPSWEQSQGARLEVTVAREIGIPVLRYPGLERVADLKPTNSKDIAAVVKLDLSLFPDTAVAYGSLAMSEGDLKYGAYNYRPGGVLASTYVAALRRHLMKWWNGQDDDPKTQVPHLASVVACAAILIDAVEIDKLQDDRPPSADTEKTLTKCEKIFQHLKTLFTNKPKRYTQK